MFITPDISEILLLRYVLHNIAPGDPQLHLFKNNMTPSESDTISSYTEATELGYSAIPLLGSSWTFAISSGTSSASYSQQTFSFTTSSSVYGYYITNRNPSSTQEVIFSERFAGAPYTLPTSGGSISITPVIKAD